MMRFLATQVLALTFSLSSFAAQAAAPTACVSLQGNGERYPALIAQVLALLERNIEPKVILGGSSASGAASLIRGILENRSVQDAVVIVDGRPLTLAEKAARIVATSPGPIGTILVLPGLNTLGHSFASAVKYVGADQVAQAFIGYPDQSIANLEAAVGQITMLATYFAEADFSLALQEPVLTKRATLVQKDWLAFSDMMLVTPKEFIRALITAPSDPHGTPRSEEIKKRYFDLFYNENARPENQPDPSRARYNQLLKTLQPILSRIPDDQLETAFLASLGLLKGLPFVSYTAVVASKPFQLANGQRVLEAYQGKTALPAGVLIHTTARIAETKGNRLVEKTGLDAFYQAYFPASDVYAELLDARQALAENESFLQHTDAAGQVQTTVDRDHLVVLEPRALAQALKVSIAEPNAFRRDPIALTKGDRANNTVNLGKNEAFVAFGGWMEHANRRTIASLASCQNVDFIVEVSNLSQGLYSFQLKAARAVIAGGLGSFLGASKAANAWMDGLWQSYSDSHGVRPEEASLLLNFDWDNASGLSGDAQAPMNAAYDRNRNAFFVRAYQDASETLNQNPNAPASSGALTIIGADLNRQPLRLITDPAQLDAAVDALLQ